MTIRRLAGGLAGLAFLPQPNPPMLDEGPGHGRTMLGPNEQELRVYDSASPRVLRRAGLLDVNPGILGPEVMPGRLETAYALRMLTMATANTATPPTIMNSEGLISNVARACSLTRAIS